MMIIRMLTRACHIRYNTAFPRCPCCSVSLFRVNSLLPFRSLFSSLADARVFAHPALQGIQFVKRLRLLHDRAKQRAEVLLYFRRADEAETAYLSMDRRDLAVDMRMRLGDWANVLRLLQRPGGSGSGGSGAASAGDDALLALARTRMGDYFADRQQWGRAVPFYEAARCYEALVECYYVTENYGALGGLVNALPEGSPLLANVAGKLQSVGLTEGAAQALLHAGDIKGAVDACVLLNQWDKALALAERHRLPQIETLLVKYGAHLTESGRSLTAVDLYKRAGRDAEAAKLLARLAADSARGKVASLRGPLRSKQLYVLAALEVERHRKRTMEAAAAGAGTGAGAAATAALVTGAGGAAGAVNAKQAAAMATAAAMSTLLKADADVAAAAASTGAGLTAIGLSSGSAASSDAAAARTLDAAWHGAEAFHFFMLAQRQLYDGDPASAMATACRLPLYEDMLEGRDAFALLALTAFYAGCLGTCSRAFVKLEALESIPPPERDAFADLALAIFSAARPLDPPADASNSLPCPTPGCRETLRTWSTNCMGCGANFPACVATGRPLFQAAAAAAAGPAGAAAELPDLWRCGTCRHRALRSAMHGRVSCPLCHAAVNGDAPAGDLAASSGAGGAAAGGAGASKPRVQPVAAAFRL